MSLLADGRICISDDVGKDLRISEFKAGAHANHCVELELPLLTLEKCAELLENDIGSLCRIDHTGHLDEEANSYTDL